MKKKFSVGQAVLLVAVLGFAVVCVIMTSNGTLPGFLS